MSGPRTDRGVFVSATSPARPSFALTVMPTEASRRAAHTGSLLAPCVLAHQQVLFIVPSPRRGEIKIETAGDDPQQVGDDLFRGPRGSSEKYHQIVGNSLKSIEVDAKMHVPEGGDDQSGTLVWSHQERGHVDRKLRSIGGEHVNSARAGTAEGGSESIQRSNSTE